MNDNIMLDLKRRSLVVIVSQAASWQKDNLHFYYVDWNLKVPNKQAIAVAPKTQFVKVTPLGRLLYEV